MKIYLARVPMYADTWWAVDSHQHKYKQYPAVICRSRYKSYLKQQQKLYSEIYPKL